jgi:hypothetical protein
MCPLGGGGYTVFVKYVVVFFLGTFIGAYIAKILWSPTVAHGHCPFVAATPNAPPPAHGPSSETGLTESHVVDAEAVAGAVESEPSAVVINDPSDPQGTMDDGDGNGHDDDDDDVTAVISPPQL